MEQYEDMADKPIITSLLDTDLYKLTMQAAIHKFYPNTPCKFKLTNRTFQTKNLNDAFNWFLKQIDYLNDLKFTDDELNYLKKEVGFLGNEHFEWLKNFKFNTSNEIEIVRHKEQDNNEFIKFDIYAKGDWEIVTLYEIPILSLMSEAYFKFVDTKWTIDNKLIAMLENGKYEKLPNFDIVINQSFNKTEKLLTNGCVFSEFGTRRRRSFDVQFHIMTGIINFTNENTNLKGKFLGTSNVFFAKHFNVKPIGTIGHEWMMGIGAVNSISQGYDAYLLANKVAISQYCELVGGEHAGLALTDTYGTDNFLKYFIKPYINYYIGVRQDSGDPFEYAEKLNKFYKDNNFKDFEKIICFSDSLNVEKCIKLKEKCDDLKIGSAFGIGTNLTNDFDSKPMNIVMKLIECGGGHAIKISDNLGKNMGDEKTVLEVKKRLSYVEHDWAEGDEANRWSE